MVAKGRVRSVRLWRRVIGVVLSYAVAIQSLFIGFAGSPQPANAYERLPAFALCVHGPQSAPDSSTGAPGHVSGSHCIFCYAGLHLSLAPSPPSLFHRIATEIGNIGRPVVGQRLFRRHEFSIAQPRGPPSSA
jgi:hypothetical protein